MGNAKRLCLFCFMRQKHGWNYFAFNHSYFTEGKIASVRLLPPEAIYKIMILHGQIKSDRIDDFQKFCRSGLNRIQFYRIRTGLRLKNFTVRSSFVQTSLPGLKLNVKRSSTLKYLRTLDDYVQVRLAITGGLH